MMLFRYLLPSLLAATAIAVPITDIADAAEELVLFKRDEVLEARDFELADAHGVNLTEMYRHALLKRDDGDHVTIWVARDFVEYGDESQVDQSLARRQTRLPNNSGFRNDWISDHCRHHKRQDHTGPNGPTSGGVQAIYRWTRGHSGGSWSVNGRWRDLIVAGSNGGTNALYRARTTGSTERTDVGTQDVRNDADWTQNRARNFNGKWRASSKGGETCDVNVRINYELIKTSMRV